MSQIEKLLKILDGTQCVAYVVSVRESLSAATDHAKDPGVAMRSSAESLLADAYASLKVGAIVDCHRSALRSLAYSVGILHPEYAKHDAALRAVASLVR